MKGSVGFRRRTASSLAARGFGPNMTPMVDIVMVILIFFMAGSAFIGPEWFLNVSMARGSSPAAREQEPALTLPETRMVVRLTPGPGGEALVSGFGLDGAPIGALGAKLREYADAGAAGAVRAVIEPSPDVAYQDVIRVYDLCQRAGLGGVGLAKSRGG